MVSNIKAAGSYVYAKWTEVKNRCLKEWKIYQSAHEKTPLHFKIQEIFGGKEKFNTLPRLKIREPRVEMIDFIKDKNMPASVMRGVDPYGRELLLLKLRADGTTTHPRNTFVVALFPPLELDKTTQWSASTAYGSHCDLGDFIKNSDEEMVKLISQIAIEKNHPKYVLADTLVSTSANTPTTIDKI